MFDNIINRFIFMLQFITEGSLFYYYSSQLFGLKKTKKYAIILIAVFYLFLYIFFTNNEVSWVINIFTYITVNFILFIHLSKLHPIIALLNSLLLESIVMVSESVMINLYQIITKLNYMNGIPAYHLMILIILTCLLLSVLTIGIVKSRKKYGIPMRAIEKDNAYIYMIPLFTVIIQALLENLEDTNALSFSEVIGFYICTIVVFVMNVFVFCLFDYLKANQQKLLESRQREQHQNEYENYNKLVSQQDTAQKILIHDIKNHLRTMQSYQKEGNYELTNSYIASLLGEDSLSKNYSPSKSITFNLLLARYRTICEEAGIDFSLDVMGADMAAVADADITALICNLMDNAISAAEKSEPSFVELSIKQKAESPIQIFSIRNSSDAVPVFDMDGIPLTSKKDSALPHSIGTKSISLVADRYNGHVLYDYNEKTHIFKTVVLLDLEKDIKD